MFRIGEFSKLTQVSIRMLRYYDETGLLKPAMTDKFTGYRLYCASQIPQLQKILLLRDMQFNISEIKYTLKMWDTKSIIEILKDKKDEIIKDILIQQKKIEKINIAIQDIYDDKIDIHYNVVIRKIPRYKVVSLRKIIPDYFYEGYLWKELNAFIKKEKIELIQGINNITLFHSEKQLDKEVDIEVCYIVKKLDKNKNNFIYHEIEDVEMMACIMVYGDYKNIGSAYYSFDKWLKKHKQYETYNPSRQICHIGAYNEKNSEKFLTEVQTPIKIKKCVN